MALSPRYINSAADAGITYVDSEDTFRQCRLCGCTDENCAQCVVRTGAPCHWVENDLCSACAPSGSSVPEAARAAARKVAYERWNSTGFTMEEVVDGALSAAAPFIVAAAVAEERATTGRRIEEAVAKELARLSVAAVKFQGERPAWPFVAAWLNDEAGTHAVRAALASPGEGE